MFAITNMKTRPSPFRIMPISSSPFLPQLPFISVSVSVYHFCDKEYIYAYILMFAITNMKTRTSPFRIMPISSVDGQKGLATCHLYTQLDPFASQWMYCSCVSCVCAQVDCYVVIVC